MNNYIKNLLKLLLCCSLSTSVLAQDTVSINKEKVTIDASVLMNYVFKDSLDREVRLSDFNGKFLFVDLWYSGCGGCITVNEGLNAVHEKLKDSNIVFFSISVDKNKAMWLASITTNAKPSKMNPWVGRYVPYKGTTVLYTGGTGYNNTFIKQMVPTNVYPKLLMINKNGELINEKPPRPDYEPEVLIEFILSKMKP
ncbi:MAG: redoxin domain-containing protein [Sphingobacteriales bacterium]|nr:MAG: redoxin domain-containing protein [Sphingobacteriales bacterium]